MNIIEETYFKYPSCGAEARGIVEINQKFGYNFTEEEIAPHSLCKVCRDVNEFGEKCRKGSSHKSTSGDWGTAMAWGRKIHIKGSKFNSYLVDLGYLEAEADTEGHRNILFAITPKGYEHSRIKHACLGDVVQWDFDVFVEVVRLRVQRTETRRIYDR